MNLILHIGAGKTGSSSIQDALEGSSELLTSAHCRYLGLMLEHAPKDPNCKWQFRGGSDLFFAPDSGEDYSDAVYKVLSQAFEQAATDGMETLIWSNEWIFGRHQNILPALLRAQQDGVNIEIVCYVRRHDRWLRSAYTQWGLKHKTYPGPLRSYTDWEREQEFSYAAAIDPWFSAFPGSVNIINYDAINDAAEEFFGLLGLSLPTKTISNVMPSDSVLALWAVYNNMTNGLAIPFKFESLISQNGNSNFGERLLPPMDKMLPSSEELNQTRQKYAKDIEVVDSWLLLCGQPPLDFSEKASYKVSVDNWEVNQLTLQLLFSLMERVRKLELEVRSEKSGRSQA